MKLLSKKTITSSFFFAAVTLATLGFAQSAADVQTQKDRLSKDYAAWKARCTGIVANGADAQWCTQEKARLDAVMKALNLQDPNSQGDQNGQ